MDYIPTLIVPQALKKPRFPPPGRARFKTGAATSNAPTGRVREVIFCGVAAPRRKKSIKEKAFA
jgi:hypothetical protein